MSGKPTYEELVLRVQKLEKDVLELKEANCRLRDNESRLREAQQLVHMGNWSWDVNSGKVEWSSEVFEIFRLDPKEFTPQIDSILALSPWPEDHKRDKELIQKAVESREVGSYEQKFLRPDGSIGYYFSSFKGGYDDSGNLTEINGVVQDITERKQVEESLHVSHEKFKSIVDNIGMGVALISPSMEILEVNHQMYEWFPGLDLDKRPLCYRTFNNPPREEICSYCPTCKTFEDGKVHEDTAVTLYTGKARNYRIVSSPLINSQGEVTAAIEIVEDITERLSLQAQLIQAQKMESVGRLAGGVAHDYNNISSIIIGYGTLALEKVNLNDSLHADIMEILAAAKRAADITRQLLAFARQQTIAPKVLDLNDTLKNMLKMLQRLIGEDIELTWLSGAEVWPVKIDPSQVDQILANLCVNARDAIADVGKVIIETKNVRFDEDYCADHMGFIPGDYVLLAVSDDGSGMAMESLDKVFEPFYTTKDVGKGTGLGLSTVYGIVKQNNGFVNAYSEPGKGTTFKVYLPRHTGEIVEERRESTLEIPLSQGETVLLVEDDGAIKQLGKRMLKDLGYTVLSAASPSEAIILAEEHAGGINLLVTDVVMPEMNGCELSEQLQTRYSNLKTLFMSGYTANVIAHRGVLDDGVCFMPKPFSKQDLAVKVREALDSDNS
jgi:two-component system, cell cycle sensor histidine kinase and response regulator CckA